MKIQNSPRKRVAMPFLLFSWLVLCFAPYIVHSADTLGEAAAPNANEATKLARMQALELRVQREGTVPVIVQLDLSTQGTARYRPEQQLPNRGAIDQQRSAIAQAQVQVLAQVSIPPWRSIKRFDRLPYLAVQVDATNLAQLAQSSQVEAIYEDRLNKLTLDDSVPLIEADSAWSAGYSGAGVAVAILDSGVDKLHSFLSGKVVEEACFSTNNPGNQASSLCPNNTEVQIGSGAGVNCTGIGGCNHGTHVAGIAAGRGTSFHGVARDADIVAIQVFSRIDDAGFCGSSTPCLAAYDSDIVQALAHISNLSTSLNIASVNISLGGRVYTSEAACDADNALTKAAIDQLSNQNIATVIAAGNNANSSGLTSPACISSAISIGASTKLDAVASYSNSAAFLDLLAPGSSITSSIPGGSFGGSSGTSMATPHVAGAWAVVKQFMGSNASVNAVLSSLVGTGTPINDARNGQTKPRIDVAKAIGLSADPLLITTLALADGVKDLSYAEQLSASGGVAPYTWSVLSGALPNGIVLNASTGQLSGTPTSSGSSAFTVQVVDNAGTQEAQPLSITVAASAPPQAQFVVTTDNAEEVYFNGSLVGSSNRWTQASSYTENLRDGINVIAVKGIDTGGIAAFLAELNWPGNQVVSDASWKVSTQLSSGWQTVTFDDSAWSPATQYGSYGVGPWSTRVADFPENSQAQWIWTDDQEGDDVVYIRYTFQTGQLPLSLTTTALPNGTVGAQYAQNLQASGGSAPYTWSILSGSLPAGLALDSTQGTVSGTPSTAQSSSVTVQVQDSAGASQQRTLTLTIDVAPTAQLSLLVSSDNAEQVYINGVLMGSSTDWRQSSRYVAGVQAGTNVIAIQADDAGGIAALIAELEWLGNVIVSDASWRVSSNAPVGWEQTNFDDSNWAFASTYGGYGVGPWFDRVVGFPRQSSAQWIWSADNSGDDRVYFRYRFEYASDNVQVNTTTLPNAQVDSSYRQTLAAGGGVAPYVWSITTGSLPAGLTLNANTGEISGTPSSVQSANFTVQVQDSAGATDTQALVLTVESASVGQATLKVTADNGDEVYVNGVLLGSSNRWYQLSTYTLNLSAGINVVAVKANDRGGIAGMLAELSGAGIDVVSDASWKVATSATAGWQSQGFDDSQWVNATAYGNYGMAPWYNGVSGMSNSSAAQWIWSSDHDADNTVYFRFSFTVN